MLKICIYILHVFDISNVRRKEKCTTLGFPKLFMHLHVICLQLGGHIPINFNLYQENFLSKNCRKVWSASVLLKPIFCFLVFT